MRKKLVWVGIALIISILLFSLSVRNVEAYTLTWFDDSSKSGGTYTTTLLDSGGFSSGASLDDCSIPSFKILSTSVDRLTDLETDNDVNGCGSTASEPRKNGVIIDSSVLKNYINPPYTDMCLPSTVITLDYSNNYHLVLGGYLYVNSSISKIALMSSTGKSGKDNVDLYNYVAIFNVSNSGIPDGVGSSVDLQTNQNWDYLFAPQTLSSTCWYIGNTGTAPALTPGLYYIEWVSTFFGDQNNGKWDWYKSQILLSSDLASTYALSTANFTIYPYYLSPEEVIQKFGVDTADKVFCNYIGGKLSTISGLPHYGCCRPGYYTDVSGNYYCTADKGWTDTIDEETYCKATNSANDFNSIVLNSYAGSSPKLAYISTTHNASDGCCGDDIPGDYGFIASVPKTSTSNIYQYLCYANPDGITNYNWLNAINNNSQIFTINKTNKDVDVISNSEEWFYCNATGNVQMDGGKAIGEGKSFSNRFTDGNYSCAEWLTSSSGGQLKFDETCTFDGNGKTTTNCCDVVRPLNTVKTASDISQCDFDCYFAGDSSPRSIDYINSVLSSFGTALGFSTKNVGYIDMDSCIANPSSCIDGTGSYNYLPYVNCSSQPTSIANHVLCNATSFCDGGIFRSTNESNSNNDMHCCFGVNAICAPLTNIIGADSCMQHGGKLFSPNAYTNCTVEPYTIPGTEMDCCLGSIVDNSKYVGQSTISNTSVLCFKEQGNNILSQCCYDSSCKNGGYFGDGSGGLLSFYDRRVLTKGSSIHTITNFDTLQGNGTNTVIQNRGYRMVINGGEDFYSPGANEISHFPMFDGFSYLEFDLLTDADDLILSLNGNTIGAMTDYSNNGGGPKVIHHIILPLDTRFAKTDTLENIGFSSAHFAGSHFTVVFDNIALVPSTYDVNTKPYYCTGGFEGWVSDLDASPNATQYSDYGQHMLACLGIASYGWTGTQCCGDDTKPRPAEQFFTGEFFNDTIAGCFAGSKVRNNQTVADSKGIWEDVVNPEADHLHTFNYSDLLYYNNSFIGCQVPQGKYANVYMSYNGTPISSKLLLSSNIITQQCAVAGPYYCMNSVWRKQIKVYGDSNAEEFPGQQVLVKTIPPGAELLAKGFRGS